MSVSSRVTHILTNNFLFPTTTLFPGFIKRIETFYFVVSNSRRSQTKIRTAQSTLAWSFVDKKNNRNFDEQSRLCAVPNVPKRILHVVDCDKGKRNEK